MTKPLIYLASPHSHYDRETREYRYKQALKVTSILIKNGVHVFSPIVHAHNLDCFSGSPDFKNWEELDYHMIDVCQEVWVLDTDGTITSKGVKAEIIYATEVGKTIKSVTLSNETVYVSKDEVELLLIDDYNTFS